MCGLYGIVDLNSRMDQHEKLYLARSLGIFNEGRGTDSSGYCYLNKDGELWIRKIDGTSSFFDYNPTLNSRLIMGHTRHGTIGGRTVKEAHPFNFRGIAFAHNGVAWADHNKHKWAQGESGVDSETMLRYIVATGGFTNENLKRFDAEWKDAVYAFTAMMPDGSFLAYRKNNPLHFAQPIKDVWVYSSDERHLRGSLNVIGRAHGVEIDQLQTLTPLRITKDGAKLSVTQKKEDKTEVKEETYLYPNRGKSNYAGNGIQSNRQRADSRAPAPGAAEDYYQNKYGPSWEGFYAD